MGMEFEVCLDPSQAVESTEKDLLCPNCKATDSILIGTYLQLRESYLWFSQCNRCPYYEYDCLNNYDFDETGEFDAFIAYLRSTTSIGKPYVINP